jgi:hypothetical protein
MKSLIAASCLLVTLLLVQGASATTIEVQNYAEVGCLGGKVGPPHPVPTDTCIAIPPSSNSTFKSFNFGAVTTQNFAKIKYGNGTDCSSSDLAFHVPCGKCLPTNQPGKGNYRYNCHMAGQFVIAEDKCNSDCSACGQSPTELKVGQCIPFHEGKDQHYVELDALAAGTTVSESVWALNDKCSGAPDLTNEMECGKCYGSSKFHCGARKTHTLTRHTQKAGGEFHHLKHLEKSA